MSAPDDLSALVADLRKLDEAATKATLRTFNGTDVFTCDDCRAADNDGLRVADFDAAASVELEVFSFEERRANAKLYVAMRNALPQLLAAAEERAALRGALEQLRAYVLRSCPHKDCGWICVECFDVRASAIAATEKALAENGSP